MDWSYFRVNCDYRDSCKNRESDRCNRCSRNNSQIKDNYETDFKSPAFTIHKDNQ